VKDFYQRDKLVKGRVKQRGNRVDLSNITCAVLNVSGNGTTSCRLQTKATTALAHSTDTGIGLSGRRPRRDARRTGGRG
jgi:polyhydroxyalkanoate synthase subunit PhaC